MTNKPKKPKPKRKKEYKDVIHAAVEIIQAAMDQAYNQGVGDCLQRAYGRALVTDTADARNEISAFSREIRQLKKKEG